MKEILECRDYKFGAIVLMVALALSLSFIGLVAWAIQGDIGYYVDGIGPNGWYHQKEGISLSQINNRTLFLPICGHDYLGPLHGFWTLGSNVNITESGWYNLHVQNGTIDEVVLREKSNGSW